MAESLTSDLKLSKRDTGDVNWGSGANANLDALDQHVQRKTLRPPRTLLASLGSGSVGANLSGNASYFYKVTAINAAGETTEGQIPAVVEAQITEPSTPLPVILQWESSKGATGYRIYKSTASGFEKFLAEVTGESTVTYTDTGNTAANNSISVPAANTARTSVTRIIAGAGIAVSPADGTGDVTVSAPPPPSAGVTSLKKTGAGTSLTGDVSIEQGNGMQLTQDDVNRKITVANAGITSFKKTGDPNTLTGDVSIEQGAGITLTEDAPNKKVTIANAGVTGIRQQGAGSPLVGDVKFDAGSGITVTQDNVNNKIVIAASGGGSGAGYATAVVAAPSGNATTDTGAIQTAINAVNTAGGGTVQLREGTYQINSTLTIPTKVTLRGMGRAATVLKAQSSLSITSPIIHITGAHACLRELCVDMSLTANNAGRPDIRVMASDVEILDCWFETLMSEGIDISHTSDGTAIFSRINIRSCYFRNWLTQALRAGNTVNDLRVDNCEFAGNGGSDIFNIGSSGVRAVVTNCVGDNIRIISNSPFATKSAIVGCSFSCSGFASAHTMGPENQLVGCTIINGGSNPNIVCVILNNSDCVVMGCRLVSGSPGKGIWAFGNNHTIVGNRISSPTAIQLEGSGSAVSGNRCETGGIVLQPGVSGNNITGNKSTFTDNSGQANVIANNG